MAPGTERDVHVGIRPEGFLLQEDGPFACELAGIEVMGRDISVISRNRASLSPAIRSIVGTEHMDRLIPLEEKRSGVTETQEHDRTVRFSLVPGKVFLFDRETGERIL